MIKHKEPKTVKPKHNSVYLTPKLLLVVILVFILILPFFPAGCSKEKKAVMLKKGFGVSKVSYVLKNEGLLRSRVAFRLLFMLRGGSVKAGEYELSTSMAPWSIISMLKSGKVSNYSITIPEGFTVRQIAKTLAGKGLACEKRIMRLSVDAAFIKRCGLDASGLEGYLFPSTYFITRDMQEEDILLMMVKEFKEAWTKSGYETELLAKKKKLFDLLRLASIVEREAETDFDRPLVAGVFVNRLKKNMKLESCATVVYAYGEKEVEKRRLFGRDLLIESPYNTYLHPGLPPGPICNPGLASIKAALYPAESKMLFFVLKNDGSNSHIFSETKAQHEEAVKASRLGTRDLGREKNRKRN